MMHGPQNVKIINAKKAKQIYQYKNIKEKCVRPTQQYGITKHADRNSHNPATYLLISHNFNKFSA
jgi:hypothetical protein